MKLSMQEELRYKTVKDIFFIPEYPDRRLERELLDLRVFRPSDIEELYTSIVEVCNTGSKDQAYLNLKNDEFFIRFSPEAQRLAKDPANPEPSMRRHLTEYCDNLTDYIYDKLDVLGRKTPEGLEEYYLYKGHEKSSILLTTFPF